MYMNDKNQRITVRLSPYQWRWVRDTACSWGVSPSDVIRILIDTYSVSDFDERGERRENEQTDIYDFV